MIPVLIEERVSILNELGINYLNCPFDDCTENDCNFHCERYNDIDIQKQKTDPDEDIWLYTVDIHRGIGNRVSHLHNRVFSTPLGFVRVNVWNV